MEGDISILNTEQMFGESIPALSKLLVVQRMLGVFLPFPYVPSMYISMYLAFCYLDWCQPVIVDLSPTKHHHHTNNCRGYI